MSIERGEIQKAHRRAVDIFVNCSGLPKPSDPAFEMMIQYQGAIVEALHWLRQNSPGRALDVLEESLKS